MEEKGATSLTDPVPSKSTGLLSYPDLLGLYLACGSSSLFLGTQHVEVAHAKLTQRPCRPMIAKLSAGSTYIIFCQSVSQIRFC